jgi:hypothetical protein
MTRRNSFPSLVALAFVAVAPGSVRIAAAQSVPQTMSFTARVYDGESPVTGAVALRFEIFDAAEGGTLVWEEEMPAQAEDGLVYAILGSKQGNGLSAAVFDGNQRFLQLSVNDDVQRPRIPLLSVPYATRAAVAEVAGRLGSLGEGEVVTGVTAGDGLSGGGAGGDVTVSVDTEYVQRRVWDTCPEGSTIQKIEADGRVVCQPDGAPGTFIVQVNAMTCARENGTATIQVCENVEHVRTDGDHAYPCAVTSTSGIRETFLCDLNVPDGAQLEEIVVYCHDQSVGGYCEGAVWQTRWTSIGTVPISASYGGVWQNSGPAGTPGEISFPIYASTDPPYTVDTDVNRYLVGLGIKAPAGIVRMYGFHVRYRIP